MRQSALFISLPIMCVLTLSMTLSMTLSNIACAAVGTTPISQSVGNALGLFVASGNAPILLQNIDANITALGLVNQDAANRELYNLAPELNGALSQITQLSFIRGMHSINHRYDEFSMARLEQNHTAIWMQVQGHWAKQKEQGEFAAYHADSSGLKIGVERHFEQQNKIGIDISLASLSTDPIGFAISENNIHSYQLDLYTNYDFDLKSIYLESNLSTAYNQYHTRRHILSGGAQGDTKSSYHAWQWGARAELGYMWGFTQSDTIKIIPVAGLIYTRTNYDSYRETSANSLNLEVKLDNNNLVRSTLGVRSVYQGGVYSGHYGNVTVMPEAYVLWSHDFHRDALNAQARFIAGGPDFKLKGLKLDDNALEAGFNITLYNGHGFNYSSNYHYEYRRDYRAHSAWLRMRYEWT